MNTWNRAARKSGGDRRVGIPAVAGIVEGVACESCRAVGAIAVLPGHEPICLACRAVQSGTVGEEQP